VEDVPDSEATFGPLRNEDVVTAFATRFDRDGDRVLVSSGDWSVYLRVVGEDVEPRTITLADLERERATVLKKNLQFALEIELPVDQMSDEVLPGLEEAFAEAERQTNECAAELTWPSGRTAGRILREADHTRWLSEIRSSIMLQKPLRVRRPLWPVRQPDEADDEST
jgi:hypothetical protein